MQYYVKIDDEYRPYPTKWQAIDYNEVMQGDGVFVSSDSDDNKTQMLIDASVEKYLQKKSKHIEVNHEN